MNFRRSAAKIFALLFLFFAISDTSNAQDSNYRLGVGTKIRVRMDSEINSDVSSVNDTFTVTVAEPVKVAETIVLDAGTIIEGRIIGVQRAASGGKTGRLSLRFETLRFAAGEKRDIDGVPVTEPRGSSSRKTSLLAVIGGTALGALLGAVSKSADGALIGAGIGAGAGTAVALLRKGKDVRIKTGEEFEIVLKKEVTLPVKDY